MVGEATLNTLIEIYRNIECSTRYTCDMWQGLYALQYMAE